MNNAKRVIKNTIFDTFFAEDDLLFRDVFCSKGPFQTTRTESVIRYPIMDAKHDDENFYLTFVVNGIDKDDIKVSLTDDIIEVKYDKKKDEDKCIYLYQKISRKSFDVKWKVNKSIVDLSPEKMKVKVKNGELVITMPIKDEFRPKKPVKLKID